MDVPLEIDTTSENIKNLEGLIKQITDRRTCAFIGAGLSLGAHYPSWSELVEHLRASTEEIVQQKIDLAQDEYPKQIELLRNLIGEENYQAEIIKLFGSDGKLDYLPVHQMIISIPFLSLLTTNYDYCLENAARAYSKQVKVQYYPELDISRLREYKNIFHIHGVISPENPFKYIRTIILSNQDYERAYQANTNLTRFLASLSEYFTLVFIGYSLNDNDLIRVIRETQAELYQRGSYEYQAGIGKRIQPKHYIIMHKEASVNEDVMMELGLIPVCYSGEKELHTALQRLLSHIQKRTADILPPEPELYREMFEDGSHG